MCVFKTSEFLWLVFLRLVSFLLYLLLFLLNVHNCLKILKIAYPTNFLNVDWLTNILVTKRISERYLKNQLKFSFKSLYSSYFN